MNNRDALRLIDAIVTDMVDAGAIMFAAETGSVLTLDQKMLMWALGSMYGLHVNFTPENQVLAHWKQERQRVPIL